jgi:autotransporter-associated beta strand protein
LYTVIDSDILGENKGIIKVGPGTLQLSASGAKYTGGTIIKEGILFLASGDFETTGLITLSGGQLIIGGTGYQPILELKNDIHIPAGQIGVIENSKVELSGTITGSALTFSTGVMIISGSNNSFESLEVASFESYLDTNVLITNPGAVAGTNIFSNNNSRSANNWYFALYSGVYNNIFSGTGHLVLFPGSDVTLSNSQSEMSYWITLEKTNYGPRPVYYDTDISKLTLTHPNAAGTSDFRGQGSIVFDFDGEFANLSAKPSGSNYDKFDSFYGSIILQKPTTKLIFSKSSFSNNLTVEGQGQIIKSGTDKITLNKGTYNQAGGFVVAEGNLSLSPSAAMGQAPIVVQPGATLGGSGTVNGLTTINGILEPDGGLTFTQGLVLSSAATLKTGIDNGDLLTVSGGVLTLGGTLQIDTYKTSGTYAIIDYNGASYSGDASATFHTTKIYTPGSRPAVFGIISNDVPNSLITITFAQAGQGNYVWNGTGSPSDWSSSQSKWDQVFANLEGNVLTFSGKGETVTLSGLAKQFDSLIFAADGFKLQGDSLNIAPRTSNASTGAINVSEGLTATILSSITGQGRNLRKTGEGTLVLGGTHFYDQLTSVSEGSLFLEKGTVLASRVQVSAGAVLAGHGTVNNTVTVNGILAPGGTGNFGILTFSSGLSLSGTATSVFELGEEGAAGVNYDQIRVAGGTLVLGGYLQAEADTAGTYTLFDYTGAAQSGTFADYEVLLNGTGAEAFLNFNTATSQVSLTVIAPYQLARIWEGAGGSSSWSSAEGKWADGASWTNNSGMVLTFAGTGEKITSTGVKNFDTLLFSADGYSISGGPLVIDPGSGAAGKVNVLSGLTATLNSAVTGAGKALQKVGPGVLVLSSAGNAYSGGTTVTAGELRLDTANLPEGDLTVQSGAALSGTGTIEGAAAISGILSPGTGAEHGTLTFAAGLTLGSASHVYFDLAGGVTPGADYDQIRVTGGTLVLGGYLHAEAASAGTYTLFDYTGASQLGTFADYEVLLNGTSAETALSFDTVTSQVNLTVTAPYQLARIWEGTGGSSSWSSAEGKWADGASWTNNSGMVLTFAGTGEKITSTGVKSFDTLLFSADGYSISGGPLNIDPGSGAAGKVNVLSGFTATLNSAVTGVGKALEKTGPGVLVLGSSGNAYSGGTTVSEGELRLDNANLPEGALAVQSGAALSGTGTIAGAAAIDGILSPGAGGEHGALTFAAGLTLGSASYVYLDLAGGTYDQIRVTGGTLVLEGNLLSVTAAAAGTYTIFDYNGASYTGNPETAFASVKTLLSGKAVTGTLKSLASSISFTVLAPDQGAMTWEGTGANSTMSQGAGGWKDGSDGPAAAAGLVVTFSGEGETVTVKTASAEDTLLFDTFNFTADGYTIAGGTLEIAPAASEAVGTVNVAPDTAAAIDSDITGEGMSLRKTGGGELELRGANDYDGGTVVEAGTLKGNTQSLQGDIVNEATLIFAQGQDGEYSAVLSGSGRLVKDEAGTLSLSGENLQTGETAVLHGALALLEDNALGKGAVTLSAGTSLILVDSSQEISGLYGAGTVNLGTGALTVRLSGEESTDTYAGDITGAGSLAKSGLGTLVLEGNSSYLGGTVIEAGTLAGSTRSLAGDIVNSATLIFVQESAGIFVGKLSGEGTLIKEGPGALILTAANEHRGENEVRAGTVDAAADLALGSGSYHLEVEGSLALGDTDQDISGLTGEGSVSLGQGTLKIRVKNERADVFSGELTGSGNILKAGYGSLVINSLLAAVNDLDVNEGTLLVGDSKENNSARLALSGAETLEVKNGAVLGGHGTVAANVIIRTGGTLSPGSSYGFQVTEGNLTFEQGSYFVVEADPENTNGGDRAVVTGTASLSGWVRHMAGDYSASAFLGGKEWLILSAGNITGQFEGAVSELLLLEPVLRYSEDSPEVYLSFNEVSRQEAFAGLGITPNQRSLAGAVASLSDDSALFAVIESQATEENILGILDSLSGETYAAADSWLASAPLNVSRDILRHASLQARLLAASSFSAPSAGSGGSPANRLWASIGGSRGVLKGTETYAKSTLQGTEASLGYDFSLDNGFLGGVVLSFSDKDLKSPARGAKTSIKGLGGTLYVGKNLHLSGGDLRFVFGAGYARYSLDSERRFLIGNAPQALYASYDAHSWQLFLETAYSFPAGSFFLEPYLTLGWLSLKTDGFAESGGPAALAAAPREDSYAFSQLGLRAEAPLGERGLLSFELGWRHLYGSLSSEKLFAFREGSAAFLTRGATPNRDEAILAAGFSFSASENVSLSLRYDGALGRRGGIHGGTASVIFSW